MGFTAPVVRELHVVRSNGGLRTMCLGRMSSLIIQRMGAEIILLRPSVTRGNALPHADVGCTSSHMSLYVF